MPETDDKRARRGTIALFTAAAALAALGLGLLFTGHGGAEHAGPRTAAGSAAQDAGTSSPASPTPPSTRTAHTAETTEASPASASLPAPMQKAARDFTIAWASHDARPGRDTSYDDASRRAAAYAASDLAADLRTHKSGTAAEQQWLRWTAQRVQVTASVTGVSLPDGAPAPTSSAGLARVAYRVTERPASGPSSVSVQHVALKLHRADDGRWHVTGLPDA
ncbi:hypothetical protein [Streptomyces sp. NPDC059743]|uniref:hypothetical protein n=1 Tax=Streptomyces sp. NPDC059743 TaxID=3346928 RepID=UPI00364A0362